MLTANTFGRAVAIALGAALLMAVPALAQTGLSAGSSSSLSTTVGAPGVAAGVNSDTNIGGKLYNKRHKGAGSASITGDTTVTNSSAPEARHVEPDATLRNNANVNTVAPSAGMNIPDSSTGTSSSIGVESNTAAGVGTNR